MDVTIDRGWNNLPFALQALELCEAGNGSAKRRKKSHRFTQLSNQSMPIPASYCEAMSGLAIVLSPKSKLWIAALLIWALHIILQLKEVIRYFWIRKCKTALKNLLGNKALGPMSNFRRFHRISFHNKISFLDVKGYARITRELAKWKVLNLNIKQKSQWFFFCENQYHSLKSKVLIWHWHQADKVVN